MMYCLVAVSAWTRLARDAQWRGLSFSASKIIGHGLLGLSGLDVHVTEIAPAGGEVRHQPQRGLVVCRCQLEIAANHACVAEMGVQVGDGLDG